MDQNYNYYNMDQEDPHNIFDEKPRNRKEKRKGKKLVTAICLGLAFGMAASLTFQAGNVLLGKYVQEGSGEVEKTPAAVENTQISHNSSTITSDVSGIVESVMPSVVSITTMSIQEVQSFFGGIQQQESASAGSGIIINQNESEVLIVTNNHVVEGANTLSVTFCDEVSVEGNIKGTDPSKDLAIVAVPMGNISNETLQNIKVATLGDSNNLQVGEPAIAIGNALGYGQSVTTGIISALDRTIDMEGFDSRLIQTDAAINPGNSGGALLNAHGEVIGINTVKVDANAVEGMGYAIPISDAGETITSLMNRETRERVPEGEQGYLGIQGVDVSSDSAQMYHMPIGVYVSEVIRGGGADDAGVVKGSIITGLNGITVDSMSTLKNQLQYYRVGEEVELTVQVPNENGEYVEQTITLVLGESS